MGRRSGKTRAFIGGCAIALSWKDAVAKRGGSYFDEGDLIPPYRQLYFDRYVKLDPCTTGQFFAEIGEPIATADLIPYEEFVQTRYYNESGTTTGPCRCGYGSARISR